MNTFVRKFVLRLVLGGLVWGGAVVAPTAGCQRKCQAAATQRFQTLSETQWRLVETTDAQVQNLDRFNFLIFNFSRNFSGNVQRVVFNDLYETPVLTFNWNISNNGTLLVKYSNIQGGGDPLAGGGEGGPSQPRSVATTEYFYDLGRELELYDAATNAYYRFVPFTGVVDPDSDCVF